MKKDWKLVNFCEFDKYAIKSYCAIHNVDESLNLGDITKVDETKLEDFNMMTWGFPCTDLSCAGKQKGFIDEDGNKTRSGMYYEGIRILREKKPALSMIENVKNLTGKKFKKEFEMILNDLEEAGYNSYYEVLNAKDFGIPQNRERVFIVSIRKDLDNGKFKFPEPFDNGIRLKDILEDEVDKKFYISDDKVQRLLDDIQGKNIKSKDDVDTGNWDNPQRGRIYSADGGSPALNCCGGGGLEPKIVTYLLKNQGSELSKKTDVANTLLARDYKGFGNQEMNAVCETADNLIKIRKLTPKECFRLMGFSDEDFFRAMIGQRENAENFIKEHPYLIGKTIMDEAKTIQGISDSQLYKQAGNSIVVDVLYYILAELYEAMPYIFDDLRLSSFFSGIGAFEVALNRLYESINTGNFTKPQVD